MSQSREKEWIKTVKEGMGTERWRENGERWHGVAESSRLGLGSSA